MFCFSAYSFLVCHFAQACLTFTSQQPTWLHLFQTSVLVTWFQIACLFTTIFALCMLAHNHTPTLPSRASGASAEKVNMPRPKKSDKQRKDNVVLDLQQDREEFFRVFEKPTQIYRFLRARHCILPGYLHRTLLYMLKRCSRTNARREKFKVNDMLKTVTFNKTADSTSDSRNSDQLKILVCGFFIDPGVRKENHISSKLSSLETEVLVRKTHRSRRKDGELSQFEESVGVTGTPINPRNMEAYEEDPLFLNTTEMQYFNDGSTVKSYSLVFRVYESQEDSTESEESSENESENSWSDGGGTKSSRLANDPAGISLKNLTTGTRRRRTVNEDGREKSDDEEEMQANLSVPRPRRKPSSSRHMKQTAQVLYEAELAMFSSDKQLLLVDGEYELAMTRVSNGGGNGKRGASWEALDGGRDIEMLSTMNSAPVLKFKLKWLDNDKPGPLASKEEEVVEDTSDEPDVKRMRRRSLAAKATGDATAAGEIGKDENVEKPPVLPVDSVEYRKNRLRWAMSDDVMDGDGHRPADDKFLVRFHFIYNNETQQQTEAREDHFCPWCQLNCMTLYGLVKHLKLCHPRFNFTYSPQSQGASIEVTVNECYDGSYCGNPQFVFAQPGMAFGRRGPVRRIQVTDTLVCRRRRDRRFASANFDELLRQEENDVAPVAHYAAGHHRLYFHSRNAVPIRPCEFDEDSEDEPDPDWLRAYTKRMLDEFTDVNEGEKPIMKLWNLFIMQHCCISDEQLHSHCHTFIDKYTHLIVRHSLRRNLLLHFVTLVDFGVLKSSALLSLMEYFDRRASEGMPSAHSAKPESATDAVFDQDKSSGQSDADRPKLNGVCRLTRQARRSTGDTRLGEHEFYDHNMSRRLQRLQLMVDRAASPIEMK